MEPVLDTELGREHVEFVTPGSSLERSLAATATPTSPGWFRDPLNSDAARYFNGEKWTGRVRKLQLGAPEAVIGDLTLESARGIAVPVTFRRSAPITVTATTNELVFKGPRLNHQREILRLDRSTLVKVNVLEGPQKLAKHSTASNVGLFGVAGLVYSALHQDEFAAQRVGQSVLEIVTADGALILVSKKSMAQVLRKRVAPLKKQAARNLALLAPPIPEDQPSATASQRPGVGTVLDSPSANDETLALLERLSQLHSAGVLTEDEFTKKKAELLGRL